MSEFRAKTSERVFNDRVTAFENTINKLTPSSVSKFEVRKIMNCLTLITGSAERSIKEYIDMGSDDKVNELYKGTVNVFDAAMPLLTHSALKEAELNKEKFERRIASFERSHRLMESYSDLKSSFKIRHQDEQSSNSSKNSSETPIKP